MTNLSHASFWLVTPNCITGTAYILDNLIQKHRSQSSDAVIGRSSASFERQLRLFSQHFTCIGCS